MKTTFFSRNVGIVVWMAVVLVLGVQGSAEALKLTPVSNKVQSKLANSTFEITFSVGLNSPAIARNTQGKRVSDHNAVGDQVRIDSSGYQVFDTVTQREFRLLATQPSGTYYLGQGPSYTDQGNVPTTASGTFYADTTNNVVDAMGKAVYERSGTGTRDDTGTTGTNENDPYKYTRLKAFPQDPIAEADRFDYNEEQITVTVNPAIIIRDKSDGQPVIRSGGTTGTMSEREFFKKLKSRVTLVTDSLLAGTYTITIMDATVAFDTGNDFPAGQVPIADSISFTLYAGADAPVGHTLAFADAAAGNLKSVDTALDVERVDNYFNVAELDPNARIRYQVIKGSGLLYVGTPDDEHTPPVSDFTVHKDADVYLKTNKTDNEVATVIAGQDPRTHGKTLVFAYTGSDRSAISSNPNPNPIPTQRIPSLSISQSGTGTTRSVTVTATNAQGATVPGLAVTLSGTALATSQVITSGTPTTITIPTTPGPYTLQAFANGYTVGTTSITVAAPLAPGTLAIATVGARSGTQQQIRVTASGRPIPSAGLSITLVGVSFPRTITIPSGSASVPRIVTLPDATSAHTVYATATGYNPSNRLTIPAPTATTTTDTTTTATTTTTTTTVSEPESVSIVGPSQRDGTANTELDAALIVQVLDDDGDAVADARVIFRVRTGQGRLSERGNGRAVAVQTDSQGYGRATYTPMSASSTVEAEVRGVTRSVEFTITASGGTATTPRETGTGTTPSTTIRPVVHVGAAQRPPMVWVDGGAIYALVGANVQKFASGVENAQNLAIGGNKVYWTEKTGASAGTINSANLDGSNVKQLTAIMAVPMGIAVDMAGSKLYWTNSRGRIQSANLDGSGITNVLQNLTSPLDIALAGGNVYWTHANGGVGFVNLRGQKQVRHISNGANAAGSLAIAGGKVYWTEQTGDTGGTINSANLNGSGVTELASIQATPIGIAVDTARSKLFWTNSRGRVQSSALDGSGIQNVVTGLGMPGDMVLSNSLTAPATTTPTTPTTAAKGKYDVNGDGSVDGRDKVLVLDAVMAGTYVAKYDVNDDKKLDILDYVLVDVAVDTGAAGAPALLGMKLTAVQIDVLQEQIDLLVATNDRSPAAMRTLIYLQQLIATARPEQTQLLANYPNPFNPETWIPYELAADTDVRLTIYNTHGVVIRTLELGHQSSGYYVGRDRAAYWDGRNAFGEPVASGVYFYQLETDAKSLMRKMVILK